MTRQLLVLLDTYYFGESTPSIFMKTGGGTCIQEERQYQIQTTAVRIKIAARPGKNSRQINRAIILSASTFITHCGQLPPFPQVDDRNPRSGFHFRINDEVRRQFQFAVTNFSKGLKTSLMKSSPKVNEDAIKIRMFLLESGVFPAFS